MLFIVKNGHGFICLKESGEELEQLLWEVK